jgi:galactitol-specific phosphotransferase system IIC component
VEVVAVAAPLVEARGVVVGRIDADLDVLDGAAPASATLRWASTAWLSPVYQTASGPSMRT